MSKYAYGPQGEVLKSTDPLGIETTFAYNSEGELTAITNGEGETTAFSYRSGDLVGITDPLGRESDQFVDRLGRVLSVTLPGGQRMRYTYDTGGKLTGIRQPSGAETTIEYDADGNPTSVTDPLGHETTAEYDVMDRLVSETDPLGRTAHWTYDGSNLLTEAEDRRGNVSTFAYDPVGRLSSARFGVSGLTAESAIEYGYDSGNRLTHISDSASGEYALSYDGFDHLAGLDGPNGDIDYAYDADGRRTAMSTSGMGAVGYEYDAANRLTGVTAEGQNVMLGYDDADRLETLVLPNEVEQSYKYDAAGEPTSITYASEGAPLGTINYAYDLDGQTEAMWGNYARVALPEAMAAAKYNAADEMIEKEEGDLAYDANGALISDGANEYTWNARGELTGISGGTNASFGYDPYGRRIEKTVGGHSVSLLYDGANVVTEEGEEGDAGYLTGLAADQLFSRTSGEGTESVLTDSIGSALALVDGSGEAVTSYTYGPFGTVEESGEASQNPFKFTGRESDGELQYNRARYYSPGLGRFISRDPSGFAGGTTNLYEYAHDNPLDFTDPSGKLPSPGDVWGAAKSVGGVVIEHLDPCSTVNTIGMKAPICMSEEEVVNTSAGIGDQLLTVPGTGIGPIPKVSAGPPLRNLLGIDNVEECSPEYASGSTATSLLRDVNTLTNVPSFAQRAEEWSGSLSHQLGEKFVYVRKDW